MYWNKQKGDDSRLGLHDQALSVRTISDLNTAILSNLSSFQQIDCIVGIPRSGLLVATVVALHLNVPLIHLNDFLSDNLAQVYTRRKSIKHQQLEEKKKPLHILVVDDATGNGVTFSDIKQRFAVLGLDKRYKLSYMGAYCTDTGVNHVDVFLEKIQFPRVFEWNLLHHANTQYFCVDMDGVLCDDPTVDENDDGENYKKFCLNAKPKIIPTAKLGAIVTARLERYRPQTEDWLQRQQISYDRLVMCNLPTAAERQRLNVHATLKADVYKTMKGMLFVESDLEQAKTIRLHTGQPVFCFGHGLVDTIPSTPVMTGPNAWVSAQQNCAQYHPPQMGTQARTQIVHALRSWRSSALLRRLGAMFNR